MKNRKNRPESGLTDDELLRLHYEDLAMPPIEEDLDQEEEGLEGQDELETESLDDPPEVSAPQQTGVAGPPVQAETRGRGRPPGSKTRKHKGVGTGTVKDTTHSAGGVDGEKWPHEADEVWNKIVMEHAPRMGITPSDIYCTVKRFGLGRFSGADQHSDKLYIARIEGDSIAGSQTQSPGESLLDYMETTIHPLAAAGSRYEITFHEKRRGKLKIGWLTLGHPEEVARARGLARERAAAMGMPQRSAYVPPPTYGQPPYGYPPPSSPPIGVGSPPPYAPPYPGAPYYLPPPQTAQDPIAREIAESTRREVAGMVGRIDEVLRAKAEAEGRPPPAPIAPQIVAPAPAAQPHPVDDQDARIARVVLAVMQQQGVLPAKPVGVGAPPATGTAAVLTEMRKGFDGLREMMSLYEEIDKFRKKTFGFGKPVVEDGGAEEIPAPIVEDPNSPAFGVRPIPFSNYRGKPVMWPNPLTKTDEDGQQTEVEESFLGRAARFAASNPDLSMDFLEKASKVLSQGAFGQLLQSFMQQGGAAAHAAAQVSSANGQGFGKPPGGEGFSP